MIFVLMGVCGCGKSSVGKMLSEKLRWTFTDADDFHPVENINKMSRGIPLQDEDRLPWLLSLHKLIEKWASDGTNSVLACSALKRSYRNLMINGGVTKKSEICKNVIFVLLDARESIIELRLKQRGSHFMSANLLKSQFDALEPPTEDERYLVVDASLPIQDIVDHIMMETCALRLRVASS